MSDAFPMLGPEPPPPAFEDAAREAVERLQTALARFEELAAQVPEEACTPEEWEVVSQAAQGLAEAVERADEGYVAVQFDSHAWYRIMESLEGVRTRLESASGVLERVRGRGDPIL